MWQRYCNSLTELVRHTLKFHMCSEHEVATCFPTDSRLKGTKLGMWCRAKEQITQQTE